MAIQQMLIAAYASGGSYWNPADKGALITVSGANNRTIANSSGSSNFDAIRSITSRSSGKLYAEFGIPAITSASNIICGVGTSGMVLTTFVGAAAGSWGLQNDASSTLRLAGSALASGLAAQGAGGFMKVAVDWVTSPGNMLIYLGVSGGSGGWYNSGNPAAGTNPTATVAAATLFLAGSIAITGNTVTLRNQVGENVDPIPSGFSMWG